MGTLITLMRMLNLSGFKLLKDEKGVTAIEYALIAALIALGIIVGAGAAGDWLASAFQHIADTLEDSGVPEPPVPPPAP